MNIQERRKFYENAYFYELDKQDKIYMRLRLPVTILVFVGPVHFFLIKEVFARAGFTFNTYSVLSMLSVIAFVYLLYCVCNGLRSRIYCRMPLDVLEEHCYQLKKYYEQYPNGTKAEDIFEENFVKEIIEATERNLNANQKRMSYIVKYFYVLPIYLFFLIITAVLYFFSLL